MKMCPDKVKKTTTPQNKYGHIDAILSIILFYFRLRLHKHRTCLVHTLTQFIIIDRTNQKEDNTHCLLEL